MKLTDKTYTIIKWLVSVVIPATVACLMRLNNTWSWNLPMEEIADTLAVIATFFGSLMGFSTALYNKEKML